MASVKFVVNSNPLDFFTCVAVKPCLPAYICAVGLWVSRQDFTLNSVQFYLMGFGPCSQSVENIFCFHFSIQHINWTSQLWILGNLVVTWPSASSSWSLITLMHRMGWRCRTLIPSWVTSVRALQVPLFSYRILQIQIHRNFSSPQFSNLFTRRVWASLSELCWTPETNIVRKRSEAQVTLARLPHFPASFGSSLTSSNLMVHLRILSKFQTKVSGSISPKSTFPPFRKIDAIFANLSVSMSYFLESYLQLSSGIWTWRWSHFKRQQCIQRHWAGHCSESEQCFLHSESCPSSGRAETYQQS